MRNIDKLYEILDALDNKLQWYVKRNYVVNEKVYSRLFENIPGRVTKNYLRSVSSYTIDDLILDKNLRWYDGNIVTKKQYRALKNGSIDFYETVIENYLDSFKNVSPKIYGYVSELLQNTINQLSITKYGGKDRDIGILRVAQTLLELDVTVWDCLNEFIGDSDQALEEFSQKFIIKIPFLDEEQRHVLKQMTEETQDEI